MPQQIDLDEINLDDLARLQTELSSFFHAYSNHEYLWCEGLPESQDAAIAAFDRFLAVRKLIRDLAIDFGIHAEFLAEYQARFSKSLAA